MHGTSAQRVHWFKQGFQARDIRGCDTFSAGWFDAGRTGRTPGAGRPPAGFADRRSALVHVLDHASNDHQDGATDAATGDLLNDGADVEVRSWPPLRRCPAPR